MSSKSKYGVDYDKKGKKLPGKRFGKTRLENVRYPHRLLRGKDFAPVQPLRRRPEVAEREQAQLEKEKSDAPRQEQQPASVEPEHSAPDVREEAAT